LGSRAQGKERAIGAKNREDRRPLAFPERMFGESALGDPAGSAWASGDGSDPRSGFSAAVREHDALLRGLARRLCGNDADADDLVHDTYERAMKAWGRFVDRGNLRGWMAAILHNLFIDRCRQGKRAPRSERLEQHEVAASEPVPPPRWAQVSGDAVNDALGELGPEFRKVYDLRAQGRSYDEIAAELGIARATVGTRLVRARQRLKELLLRELGEEQ
jgi:RNA polymerase sigma-70 factor, ECF subfamily